MKTYLEQMAQLLEANSDSHTFDENVQWLTERLREIENICQNRGCNENTGNSIFGYILNHHTFEIENHEKIKIIINTLLELACPAAVDDERSKDFIEQLMKNSEKRK